ncbi:MAG TPA: TlpA disulfide reductase family protein [Longimicrobiales bacterium]|nr:TlpA disulfide reductase family protein [Longimicrobiales bacterium]
MAGRAADPGDAGGRCGPLSTSSYRHFWPRAPAAATRAQPERFGAGIAAPDYAATTLAGDTVALADLRGAPVLLNVWATWCAPCREEMPDLQAIADEFAAEGLRVVGVSIDQADASAQVQRFVDDYGISFTVLHDPRGRVTRSFRTIGVPETFLLDGEG